MSNAAAPNESLWLARDETPGGSTNDEPPYRAPRMRGPLAFWNNLIFANGAVRREAKAVLFGELAEAARQGMPMDLALFHASQTLKEASRRIRKNRMGPGADSRYRGYQLLIILALLLIAPLALAFYLIFVFRYSDTERVSRMLARRLYPKIKSGLPLSQAMQRCGLDYTEADVSTVRAGEYWGRLPVALNNISKYQRADCQLASLGMGMAYPLLLALIVATIAMFNLIFILPKFKDIYDQLGAELPGPTLWFISVGRLLMDPMSVPLITPLIVFIIFLFLLLVRQLMNGNRITKYIVLFLPLVSAISLLIPNEDGAEIPADAVEAWLFVMLAVAVIIAAPYYLRWFELAVLSLERRFGSLTRFLPLAGVGSRAEAQARWLSSLSLALSAGEESPAAIRSAGIISGAGMKARSEKAASLAERGRPIGEACAEANLLADKWGWRLRYLDGKPDFLPGLQTIAEDANDQAAHTIRRIGIVIQIFSVVAIGLVVAAFAIAMYLPLFNIPLIVGVER